MMDWNRSQQVVHKWQPFGVPHVQIQHEQIPHHIEIHHVDANQPPLIQPQQHQPQPQIIHQTSKASKSSTPHCLICNVHLGMFAKGGMEVFSDKVTTSLGKQQIHCVLGNILNEDLSTHQTHSNIICKKCFKLIDDIDALEDKLGNMKQVVSNKYTMTLSLVKRGMIGKAVVDEHTKDPLAVDPKKKGPSASPQKEKILKIKAPWKKGPKPGKRCEIFLKDGKVVVKQIQEFPEEKIKPNDHQLIELDAEDMTEAMNDSPVYSPEFDSPVEEEFDDIIKTYMCSVCDKPFDNKISLVQHMEIHGLKEDWLECNVCQKGFLTAESLKKHKKTHKKASSKSPKKSKAEPKEKKPKAVKEEKRFECRFCGKVFNSQVKHEDHERLHTGEKPFECETCGTCFRSKNYLVAHVRVNHQGQRFKCDLCGKEFKWKRLLTGHKMSVHTGERPYQCEFCDQGFVYQQHYKKHMRIHTGERPYTCDICGKSFNSQDNCRVHMFTHSDKKPYECGVCGAGFMRKPMVLTHIQQHSHVHCPEEYVKVNSIATPVTPKRERSSPEQSGSGGRSSCKSSFSRKKKKGEEHQEQQLVIEEDLFGTFQSQPTMHITSLHMEQW